MCRGCKRFEHEVQDWNTLYNLAQKQAVERRLVDIICRVMRDKVAIQDSKLLLRRLEESGAPFPKHRDALCLIIDMLRAAGNHIKDPTEFGFTVMPAYQHLSFVELREFIDNTVYELSVAYYERHVAPAQYAK